MEMFVLQLQERMENPQLANYYTRFYLNKKIDTRLVGNIGNPILSEKK